MPSMPQVGAYERISDDTEDTGLGVARQRRDNEAVAHVRRWPIHEHYEDNDVSAYKHNVRRDAFERMLHDLERGVIGGIVVYNLDRLARQPRDLERVIDLYDERPGLVFATVEGDINLATADGRTMARVMVAFANKSSADTGRRTARKHLELAQAGIPVGGRRPFGWQKDKRTLLGEEAQLVRDAVVAMLAGKPLSAVVRDWNEAGVVTTAGKHWSPQTLRNYLRSPRHVGLRTHRGRVALDDEGHPIRGQWEPMLDQETWDRLQLVVGKKDGQGVTGRRGARTYLLTGILRCGLCRGFMYGSKTRDGFNYVCNKNTRESAEKHTVSISGRRTDSLVGRLVVQMLERESLVAQNAPEWSGEGRLREIREQIDSLMAAFLDGKLSEQTVFPRVERLEREEAELQQGRTQWLRETTGPALQQITLEQWTDMTDDERRPIVERVLPTLYVKPRSSRAPGFDPDRLVPVLRGSRPLLHAVGE